MCFYALVHKLFALLSCKLRKFVVSLSVRNKVEFFRNGILDLSVGLTC